MTNGFSFTENIFSTIGNDPVFDQFDVLYSSLLSGSINDGYVTGSLFTRQLFLGGGYITSRGERGRVFSKSGNNNNYPSFNPADESYSLQPWRERAGNIRNIRIFSEAERFYDSMMPGLVDLLKVLNAGISYDRSPPGYAVITIGNYPGAPPPPVARGLTESFPFESKFSSVKKVKNLRSSFLATLDMSGGSLAKPIAVKSLSILIPTGQTWRISTVPGYVYGVPERDSAKILFGFGDLTYVYPSSTTKYLLNARKSTPSDLVSPILRGWKYGLISGLPTYTSAVFRRDRFGQFRDMLEQRPFSSFIHDVENSPANSFDPTEGEPLPAGDIIEQSKRKNGLKINLNLTALTADYPINVKFVRKKLDQNQKLVDQVVPPENTLSSNLSMHVTSSLPYFDGIARNRPPIFTLSNAASVVLNVSTDNFGNIKI